MAFSLTASAATTALPAPPKCNACLFELSPSDPVWGAQDTHDPIREIFSLSPTEIVRRRLKRRVSEKLCQARQQATLLHPPNDPTTPTSTNPATTSTSTSPSPTDPSRGLSLRPGCTPQDSLVVVRRLLTKEKGLGDFIKLMQTELRPYMRGDLLAWLKALNEHFKFGDEVFSLTARILDQFLCRVRVQLKYMQCLGVACFLVASKVVEEEEHQPSLSELSANSGHAFTPNDIRRMERIVVKKMNWELRPVTYYQMMSELVGCIPAHKLTHVDRAELLSASLATAHKCVLHYQLAQHAPSKLALAITARELMIRAGLKAESVVEYLLETIGSVAQPELDLCILQIDQFLALAHDRNLS